MLGRRRGRRWLGEHPPRRDARSWLRTFLRGWPTNGLRRAIAGGRLRPGIIPARLRRALDVDGGAVHPLRVEIGGGPFPEPGYVHVDADRRSSHLEHVAPAWALPFADGTVEEILAVHVLEHIPAGRVVPTLREWYRVLRPGGLLQVHVPNARPILGAYLEGGSEIKWAAISAIYGTPTDLGLPGPSGGRVRSAWSPHRVLYDLDLMEEVLVLAGFDEVADVSAALPDRHTAGWDHLIAGLSLVVRARRPA